MTFTHLHVSSAYSAHYGVSWPKDLAAAAASHGADALACTDRDGLYGSIKHLKACMEHGLDPILGVDLALIEDEEIRTPHGTQRVPVTVGRVVVLAKGHSAGAGYRALCRTVSAAHEGSGSGSSRTRPVGIRLEELARLSRNDDGEAVLAILVGPRSDVGQAAQRRQYGRARTLLQRWKTLLPAGSVYVEAVSHLSRPGERLSTAHAVRMIKAARQVGVPYVLSNAVRYLDVEGAATADVLDAARTLTSLDTLPESQPNGQGWLKTPEEMKHLAREIGRDLTDASGIASTMLSTTEALADWCRIDPVADCGYGIPVVPEARIIGITGDANRELAARCEAGITKFFPPHAGQQVFGKRGRVELRERLDEELSVIQDLGFASYFLTVAEVTKMINGMGVRTAARGSGASSLVNYLTGISHVNPLMHELLFERFLSRDRSTLPDIDVDVESARRHDVYHEIFKRFGAQRTSLMSMQNGYRARGAVRDAGLALGMPEPEVDAIAKQLWRFSASSFREAMERMPELKNFSERVESGRLSGNQQLDLLVDLTERLDRLPRHISMHPCGVILGDATLLDRTPVEASGMGLPMSQFDKHDMDPMGMLKLDVLGVRMQSAIAYTLEEIQRIHGTGEAVAEAGAHGAADFVASDGKIALELVPYDDAATFELIRSTHTLGCFQIESPGQRELIGKLAPWEFNDLIIDISLFRPGPMQSDMVRPFLEQRHGFREAVYPHPDLEPVLAETHGVTVFHEQVLRMMHVMTDCGLAKADVYRRLLGNPKAEPQVEAFFREKALAKGYPLNVIDKVWQTLHAFGSFGFCKAHGAAFAVPTYHSAWLKAHHPEAFLAALWEHDPGMYPRRLLVAEARRMGIPILPLDVNRSTSHFRVERVGPEGTDGRGKDAGKLGIRMAFTVVHGLSEIEVKRLEAHQPYTSVADVRDRARPTRTNLRRLAELGALDRFNKKERVSRTDLVHHLDMLRRPIKGKKVPVLEGQLPLPFDEDVETSNLTAVFPEPTQAEKVRTELDLTEIDVSAHLMESHRKLLDAYGVTYARDLLSLRSQTRVLVAGVRVATQTPPMRSGKRVVFISLDDGTGCVDASFFTEAQHESGEMLFSTRLMLIEGTTRRTGPRAVSLQAIRAWNMHQPETLPPVTYLKDTEEKYWQERRESARKFREEKDQERLSELARALAGTRAGTPGSKREIPHHDTGWPVRGIEATEQAPSSSSKPYFPPVPVPHPETRELMPTPQR